MDGHEDAIEAAIDARLTIADTLIGTIGSPPVQLQGAQYGVLAAGVYHGEGADSDLVACPLWTLVSAELVEPRAIRRTLDLRAGILHQHLTTDAGTLRVAAFSSLAHPGIVGLRADGLEAVGIETAFAATGPLVAAPDRPPDAEGRIGDVRVGEPGTDEVGWMCVDGDPGGVAVAAADRWTGASARPGDQGSLTLERLGAYVTDTGRRPTPRRAVRRLGRARARGWERLLEEHRTAWARRWDEADIRIDGDRPMQLATRFALFHLMSSAATHGEAAVGARALTGPAYRGHVFWDADVFVLPFLAATHPSAARAMLEYRVRRLDDALAAAREAGRAGAWFPWESAHGGRDVTPTWVIGRDGTPERIWTGDHEEHIVADVAWAAATYVDWTGDAAFERGPGLRLLAETARYWAGRVQIDPDGSGHLRDVVGPDEYHERVDDDVFTNGLARWNLRRAARTTERLGAGSSGERERWLDIAGRIVEGYDEAAGRHEQFAGFYGLRPLIIAEIRRRPLPADLVLGRPVTTASQIVKQADVLMLHHVAPEEARPDSLERDMDYYEPRTSHGSSLSPGVHASLLARLGRTEQALEWLHATAALDLGLGATEKGLHIAAMGSLWQAIVNGFAGVRPSETSSGVPALGLDPRLPREWERLEIPLRYRGRRVRLTVEHDRLEVEASAHMAVRFPGEAPLGVGPGRRAFVRVEDRWQATR